MFISRIPPLISFKSNKNVSSDIVFGPHFYTNPIEEWGDSFTRQFDAIDAVRIRNLDIKNLRLVDSSSVRGQCLANKNLQLLEELRESGIETVIDLRSEGSPESKYAKKCSAQGLEYFNFKVKESMPIFNPIGCSRSFRDFYNEREVFVKELDRFFKLMERGRVYIGCLLGLHRTDLAVSMNYLLNPKEPQTPPSLSHMFIGSEENVTNKRIGSVKNLLKNLLPEHREFLGIPKEYEEIFRARITKLRLMNLK